MRQYRLHRFFNWVTDWLTGCNMDAELKKIIEMERWTQDRIQSNQAKKFIRLSQIASLSEYYKSFAGKPLEEYPVITRDEFSRNSERMKTRIRKPYYINHTSGSTGTPVAFIVSWEMLMAKRLAHQKMLIWNDVAREAREFKIGGIPANLKYRLYYYLRNKRFIHSFRISNESIDGIIRKYNRFKPEVLYGYPSAIINFIQYAEKRGIPLHQPLILVTHAENQCPDFKQKFVSVFPGTQIVNQYWASEANIGVTCPEGNLHIDEESVICEVINQNELGTGDLLVTNLYSYDQPIIRYKLGDRVKLSDKECPCGRKTKIIEYIDGRSIEEIDLPDGRRMPVTVFNVSRYSDNVAIYQLIYHNRHTRIELRYLPIDKKKPINEKSIEDYFRSRFDLEVIFKEITEVEYTPGGKYKKLIKIE